MPARIAFPLIGGRNWTGGYNYLINLVRALAIQRPDAITPVLCFGADTDPGDAAPFERIDGAEVIRDPAFNESRRSVALAKALILGRDAATQAIFARARIDAIFENAQFTGWRTPLPAIAWIPDFQHRYMPQLFSRIGYWKREIGFRAQVATGRTIMLSSEDTRQACEHFHPSTAGRTHVVPFAVPMPPCIDPVRARAVADSYGLPKRYLFMPNQFWQHKNHTLVLEALALLKARGRTDIVVAASGKTLDPRLPRHFPALQARITKLGLETQFRILGMVPYNDLASLMRSSDALLNPSLFEGWSTTVEEARAAGVPMLLSDLPVHREQAVGLARFFYPYSATSLADALIMTPPAPPTDDTALTYAANARVAAFAEAFVALAQTAVLPALLNKSKFS